MLEIENKGKHIATVMNHGNCNKHKAAIGEACWYVHLNTNKKLAPAVCGARIKRAGYVGTISSDSLRTNKPTRSAYPHTKLRTNRSAPSSK